MQCCRHVCACMCFIHACNTMHACRNAVYSPTYTYSRMYIHVYTPIIYMNITNRPTGMHIFIYIQCMLDKCVNS